MKLNLEFAGEVHSFDLEGDDLPGLILHVLEHFDRHYPETRTLADFPVVVSEAVLNGLACDLPEVDLQLN